MDMTLIKILFEFNHTPSKKSIRGESRLMKARGWRLKQGYSPRIGLETERNKR